MKKTTLAFATLMYLSSHLSMSTKVNAQVVGDSTLPNNAQITQQGNQITISGGTQAQNNLFLSFSQFSVLAGEIALFNNGQEIQNIISRVTGNSASLINGTITANGNANLFFINPNGIIFGPDSSVLIGGSFIGSTANSIVFTDNIEFDTIPDSNGNLLSSELPVSLIFNTDTPAPIYIFGTGHNFSINDALISPVVGANQPGGGLQVGPEKSLLLVGGDIYIDGGILTSPGGRIGIASIKENGVIGLTSDDLGWSLNLENIDTLGIINLANKSALNISGIGQGNIQLFGNDINFRGGSIALMQNQGSTLFGNLDILATNTLSIEGTSDDNFPSRLVSEAVGTGKAGDINMNVGNLVLNNGGSISNKTYSGADGGDININSRNLVQISGFSSINPSYISNILAGTTNSGNAGDITIQANIINAISGGSIINGTLLSTGNAGKITLNANLINLIGASPTSFASGIYDVTVGFGDAGSININTEILNIFDGGTLSSSTANNGDAGEIVIKAETINIDGVNPYLNSSASSIQSSAGPQSPIVGQLFQIPILPNGGPGNITIETNNLNVSNNAFIITTNNGTSNKDGGNLQILADRITLKNRSFIRSGSALGSGGNLEIHSGSLIAIDSNISSLSSAEKGGNVGIFSNGIVLKNSSISSSAKNLANGGNTTINAQAIAGDYNSSISANAEQGKGGNIKINTDTLIFPLKNITASSDLGIDFSGTIEINAKDFGPQMRKESAPIRFTEPSTSVCNPSSNKVSFVITADDLPTRMDDLAETESPIRNAPVMIDNKTGEIIPVVEVQGWVDRGDGTATSVAYNEGAFGGSYRDQVCKELAKANAKTK
jgi:filamentous hemagglutinin family protein